ncbi:MAG: STM4014 family protein [Pirellulaceae bacterium]
MNGVSLRSESDADFCILGNPENRRVRDFQAAAEAMGLGRPPCLSWRDLLDAPQAVLPRLCAARWVRLDSPGENDDVAHRLIRLGGGRGRLGFGEIGFLREQHQGFRRLLDRLSALGAAFPNSPADIRVMFDKWSSHERFTAAGVPRPAASLAPASLAAFRAFRGTFCTATAGRVFLKPRYASSASGVCAYRWSGDREQLIAPIQIRRERATVRLYNSLRVRRYTAFEDVDAILGQLLPQGMICERWIRKAQLPHGQFDLRVLVIAGEARHIVVRQSHSPMTNLHLGNRRGDLNEVEDLFGAAVVERCRRIAEQAAACFPDSLYAGVDVLVPARGEPLICEINAFGDLLPNVKHRGESTYEAILRASHVCGSAV